MIQKLSKVLGPPQFEGLQNLEKLKFQTRSADIPPGIFKELKNLTHLEFVSENVTNLVPDTFSGLMNLHKLILRSFREQSKLATIIPGTFRGLKSLRFLELDRFRELTSLQPGIFDDLPHLERLLLTFTGITSIEQQSFKGLSNLKDLGFHSNKLGNPVINVEEGAFAELSNLEFLSLIEGEVTGEVIKQITSELPSKAEICMGINFGTVFK